MRRISLSLMISIMLLGSCGGPEGPTVMSLVGASPGILEVSSWSLDGKRDGARTRATVAFELAGGQELTVDLLLAYDPQPVLEQGTWATGTSGGSVTAERVRFVGGQGQGPSIGGDYVLVDERNLPRFRIQFPLTTISTPVPRP